MPTTPIIKPTPGISIDMKIHNYHRVVMGIYVLNFNLIGRMVWLPQFYFYLFLNLGCLFFLLLLLLFFQHGSLKHGWA